MPTQSERPAVTALMYHRVFEGDPVGRLLLEDLVRRFSKGPVFEGGIDGVRKSDFRAGSREVVEFIVRKINQATGAEPETQENEE